MLVNRLLLCIIRISTTNQPTNRKGLKMKKHNIELVKMLRSNTTPMNKFDLYNWLKTYLAETDISATANDCVDKRGFVAHEVILSDNHGASRKIIVPVLADSFTFDEHGIYTKYGINSTRTRVGNKNMYIVSHERGHILVSYGKMICFYHFEQNVVYFKRNAFYHSVTTSKHVYIYLTEFVKPDALKMFAKQNADHD